MPAPLVTSIVFALGISMVALADDLPGWPQCAPEQLPPVTVRWEDPNQSEVFVVEGARYRCRVATWPARILSLSVDGEELLGSQGMGFAVLDATGRVRTPAPREFTPDWETWQGQSYKPANSSRARMNVWSAGPYYWDAHLLDIPLLSPEEITAGQAMPEAPALHAWSFDDGLDGWQALNSSSLAPTEGGMRISITGEDPFISSPQVSVQGPFVAAVRMRSDNGGGGAFYWYSEGDPGYEGSRVRTFGTVGDGQWHVYRVPIDVKGKLRQLRLDPPGSEGSVEIDWIRLEEPTEASAGPEPVRGEVIFHAHPDQLRIEFRADAPAVAADLTQAILLAPDTNLTADPLGERPVLRFPGGSAGTLALGSAGARYDLAGKALVTPVQGASVRACWAIRPLSPGQRPEDAFQEDLTPLPASAFSVQGGYADGYDPVSGLYILRTAADRGAFSFEAAYKNPTGRLEMPVRITGDVRRRNLTFKCITGIGNLEAAVLTDLHGFPLPVPAFVAKNFGGEMEEPDDSAFGDSYFPLTLEPGAEAAFQVVHLLQNWGQHPLKQVSSIRFFHIYWHLSTGASETTCFTHNWMPAGSRIFHIPDFRPMSGEMWPGQPQHGVGQWPGFLQYNNASVKLVYDRTTFASVAPCLSRFTMDFHTSDGAATASVQVMEAPHRDEMRTFLRLRYDWQQPVTIQGDARTSFRWLNMNERQGADLALWTDAEGDLQTAPVEGNQPQFLGELLAADSPVIGAHGRAEGEDYHSLVLIRSFRARLGGQDMAQVAASSALQPRGGDYWLTVPGEELSLQSGDFLEAEVMLMPHGDPVPPEVKPLQERERFGLGAPAVEVAVGSKSEDFPATVRAEDEAAAFTLRGGFDLMPVIVEGFARPGVPLLWREDRWQDQQVHGGDGYQVEPDGNGGYRFVFAYPTRRGQEQHLKVTRAECTSGISRVFGVNGHVALEAPESGEFALKAPRLFAPGSNTCAAGAPFVSFGGSGLRVRSVPVSVAVEQGQTQVELSEWGAEPFRIRTSGAAATVSISELHSGATYAVTVDGQTQAMPARNETIQVKIPAGEHVVVVERR